MSYLSRPIAAMSVVVVLLATACGGVAETVAEQIAEEAAGGDVDLDIDEDGGNVKIESDEGTMEIGSDLDLPDGLTVDVPSGGSVMSVLDFDTDLNVAITFDMAEFDNLVDFYTSWTAQQSGEYSLTTNEYDSADGISFKSATWYNNESGKTISVTSCFSTDSTGEEPNAACLAIAEQR